MSDTKNTTDKTLSVSSGKKPLSLKRTVEQGTVRQSFSHGRTKSVVVEKKRRRIVKPGEAEAAPAPAPAAPAATPEPAAPAPKREVRPSRNVNRTSGDSAPSNAGRTLTSNEMDARAHALAEAKVREEAEREREAEEAKRRAEEEAIRAQEQAEAEARQREEEARRKADRDTRKSREDDEPVEVVPAAAAPSRTSVEDAAREAERLKRQKAADPKSNRRDNSRRRSGKLTISSALSDEEENRGRSLAAMRRRREREKRQVAQTGPREKVMREVIVPEAITIQELANRMAERGVEIIKTLMKQGQMVKITDTIDGDTAELIVEEFGHTVKRVSEADVEEGLFNNQVNDADGDPRAPVVTIMGHVDHGKTSLLDSLREANVVSGEAGGITQHIGAYQVSVQDQKITFIDTPGHEAFTAMRARGAGVTDIVVLVVAGDDGVKPQTIEAINHAKAAGVPMIVAINKMDKPDVDPTRVRTDLLQHEVIVESMSGDVQDVEVSALKKTGLDNLLEAIALQSELLELKASRDVNAEGVVIEAKLDKGRGPVGTLLVQRGSLKKGDIIVAGAEWAKVRALISDTGDQVDEAGPSVPVEVLGFTGAPAAGDRFAVVDNEARAREITDYRVRQERQNAAARGARGSLEQMMSQLKDAERSEFPLLVKADVQGSSEAIAGALEKLNTDEVASRIILSGVGGITESDVSLAAASNAAVIGFNVRANSQARNAAEASGIEIRYYNVIYDLIDDVKAAMAGMLSPERRETFLGNAEILEIFSVSKVGKVAGCRVTEGTVERGAAVRLIRDNVVIHEGELSQLKRFKDDVNSVVAGQECGMAFANYQDMRQGDVIECFRVEEVARTL
ncbi:MAG: translation initiation factor IF-2 [Pseudomonadota bacterium]